MSDSTFNVYKDIQTRTGGAVYLGVVGPVRTGKSTFIKRFMDMLLGLAEESQNFSLNTSACIDKI